MPRRKRMPRIEGLPEAHRIVLALLSDLDNGDGVTWDELRVAAADRGVGERELRAVLGDGPDEGGA